MACNNTEWLLYRIELIIITMYSTRISSFNSCNKSLVWSATLIRVTWPHNNGLNYPRNPMSQQNHSVYISSNHKLLSLRLVGVEMPPATLVHLRTTRIDRGARLGKLMVLRVCCRHISSEAGWVLQKVLHKAQRKDIRIWWLTWHAWPRLVFAILHYAFVHSFAPLEDACSRG